MKVNAVRRIYRCLKSVRGIQGMKFIRTLLIDFLVHSRILPIQHRTSIAISTYAFRLMVSFHLHFWLPWGPSYSLRVTFTRPCRRRDFRGADGHSRGCCTDDVPAGGVDFPGRRDADVCRLTERRARPGPRLMPPRHGTWPA